MARRRKNNGLPYVASFRGEKRAVIFYDGDKRFRQVLSTEEKAEEFCRDKALEIKKSIAFEDTGLRAVPHTTLTQAEIRDAENGFAMLKKQGFGETALADAVAFFLDNYRPPNETPLIRDFSEKIIEGKENKRRTTTVRQLKTNLREFGRWCEIAKKDRTPTIISRLHEVETRHIESYLDSLMVRPHYGNRSNGKLVPASETTKSNRLRSIKTLFNAAIKHRHLKYNPATPIDFFEAERKPKAFLTIDQVLKLLKEAKKEGLFFHFYFRLSTMIRTTEMVRFSNLDKPWRFINLDQDGFIELPASCCKTRSDQRRGGRKIYLATQPNLRKCLLKFKDQSLKGSRHKERRLFTAIGVKHSENILRDTAISLHARYVNSTLDTALEAGNSETMIKDFYLVRYTREDATKFFDLMPSDFGF